MLMKGKHILLLLAAAGALSLAGCQKTGLNGEGSKDGAIRFAANAAPGTKTEYSGVVDNKIERINWLENDVIRIYSDNSVHRYQTSQHYADYSVTSATPDGRNSRAEITPVGGNGLVWGEKGDYTFYAIYPPTTSANGASGVLNASIPGSQTVTVAENVASPDMSKAFMTAAAYAATTKDGEGSPVTLSFSPAFTAFEFTLRSTTAHKITGAQLKSLSTALAGDFTVTYTEKEDHTFTTAYGCPAFAAGTNNVVSTSFPGGVTVNSTTSTTFTLFALPQELTDLTLNIMIKDSESSPVITRTLGLSNKNGEYIKFDACKKHRIYGLEMPDGTWKLYLETEVAQWEKDPHTPVYGNATADGVVINASALEFASGVGSREGRILVTLKNPAEPLVAYFGLFAPTGENCKWRITMKGENAGHFTLSSTMADETHASASGDGEYIEGSVSQRVLFTLTPNEAPVELYFTVVVTTKTGEGEEAVATSKEYSLHSEVTRDTRPLTVKMP